MEAFLRILYVLKIKIQMCMLETKKVFAPQHAYKNPKEKKGPPFCGR